MAKMSPHCATDSSAAQRLTVIVWFEDYQATPEGFASNHPNPGLGGTQFLSLQLSVLLAELHNDLDVRLVSNRCFRLNGPKNLEVCVVEDLSRYFVNSPLESLGVILSPTRVLEQLNSESIARVAERTIVHSHHLFDRSLAVLERKHTFAGVACVSRYQFSTLQTRSPKYYLRNLVIPNWEFAAEDRLSIRRKADLELLYLGALTPDKGVVAVAKAWPMIRRRFDSVRLHVIGGSETHGKASNHPLLPTDRATGDEILQYIPLGDINGGRVVFYGNLGACKAAIIRQCDAALLNLDGHRESFCLAAYECLSLGVPILGCRAGAMREIMMHFPELTISRQRQVVSRLARLMSDPTLRSSVRKRCVALDSSVQADNAAVLRSWATLVSSVNVGAQPELFAPVPKVGEVWWVSRGRAEGYAKALKRAAANMVRLIRTP